MDDAIDLYARWSTGCPYNHDHGPWCDDAELFRVSLAKAKADLAKALADIESLLTNEGGVLTVNLLLNHLTNDFCKDKVALTPEPAKEDGNGK